MERRVKMDGKRKKRGGGRKEERGDGLKVGGKGRWKEGGWNRKGTSVRFDTAHHFHLSNCLRNNFRYWSLCMELDEMT